MDLLLIPASIKQFIVSILIAGTALLAWQLTPDTQSNWLLLSAFGLACVVPTTPCKRPIAMQCLTAMLVTVTSALVGYLGFSVVMCALSLFVITLGCTLLKYHHPDYLLFAFVVNVFVIFSLMFPASFPEQITRSLYLLMGFAIVIGWQLLLIFSFKQDAWISSERLLVQVLRQFSAELMTCLLQPDYADHRYVWERRLHRQKNHCMCAILNLHRSLCSRASGSRGWEKGAKTLSSQSHRFTQWNALFDILLNCAQLKRQISDETIIDVCKRDLAELGAAMDKAWSTLLKANHPASLQLFQWKIEQLDDVYQHVLQTTAPDPLVFFLFIANLKSLHREMKGIEGA